MPAFYWDGSPLQGILQGECVEMRHFQCHEWICAYTETHRAHAMLCAVGSSALAASAAACSASASSESGAPARRISIA